MKTLALITAAGRGRRMGSARPKQFLALAGKPILAQTVEIFERCRSVDGVFIIAPQEEMDPVQREIVEAYRFQKVLKVVRGGRVRQQSVFNGLKAVKADCEIVIVHDGVRPLITPALIEASIEQARKTGAAIVAVPARDTVKRVRPGGRLETLPREEIWLAQTPQTFQFPLLFQAHQKAAQESFKGTDDASLVERLGQEVSLIPGDYHNLKITTPEDLSLAEAWRSLERKSV
ncbi:MAG: 2-C-methyl-D-erythritol 4-phosphate cytidylyltransferase [Deltaproteobacteria bacterium]|nr:2-C-methyl-D-erythritol 4-phosphate cytidylyltransferase [Deltaproteobacteria bacterium]